MLAKKLVVAVAVLALMLGSLALGSYVVSDVDAQAKAMKWEYKLIGMRLQPRSVDEGGKKRLVAEDIQTEFNFQGGEGWEYVDTIPGKEDAIFLVFKRKATK